MISCDQKSSKWQFFIWGNFSKVCLQFFSFFHLFYDNITFRHLFNIIKCPAELNCDCKILIRSVPSTFITGLLSRGYVFGPNPRHLACAQKQITTHYQTYPIMAINTINQICLIVNTLSNISVTGVTDNLNIIQPTNFVFVTNLKNNSLQTRTFSMLFKKGCCNNVTYACCK